MTSNCNRHGPRHRKDSISPGALGEGHELLAKRKPKLFVFTPRYCSDHPVLFRDSELHKQQQGRGVGVPPGAAAWCHRLMELGVAWQDDGPSPHPNDTRGYRIPSSWGGIGFPCLALRSGKPKPQANVGAVAFSHRGPAGLSRGTPETPSTSQSVERGGEMLHTGGDRANTALGRFWLDQALRYVGLGGRKVGGGEGTKLPSHLRNFPSSPRVPACPQSHRLPAASGCLRHPRPARNAACS